MASSPDPQRASHFIHLLLSSGGNVALLENLAEEQRTVLFAVLGGSQTLGETLVARPEWLPVVLDIDGLRHPRSETGMHRELATGTSEAVARQDFTAAFAWLRDFKQRETLRIAARDLGRLGKTLDIVRELSQLATVALDAAWRFSEAPLRSRLGAPYHQTPDGEWLPTPACVLGMGKLGGYELNYSSDVDVLFVYEEEGSLFKEPPKAGAQAKGLSTHQYFRRVAEAFVGEVGRLAAQGMLYRIDLRLRPEGDSGPLVRSLPSYENYYSQWGQTWERMMLIKARPVAGSRTLGAEFLEMVQPFRFPRSLSQQALAEIAAMKRRIEVEVVRGGELERNVKLGRGGIREIEFIAQSLQVLYAGRLPFLADSQTVPALQKLVQYQHLSAKASEELIDAYCFLRDVEHRLQMENNLQTHTLPESGPARDRIARSMGFTDRDAFEARLLAVRNAVRGWYDTLVQSQTPVTRDSLPQEILGAEAAWRELLASRGFRDPDKGVRLAQSFILGPGFGHVSTRTADFARLMFSKLLDLCPDAAKPTPDAGPDGDSTAKTLSDPDRVLARLDSFISAYGARSMLFETWASSPSLFELLVLLFDRSEFLAETAIRTPDLVDELELSGRLRRGKTSAQILADLRHGADDADQRLWIRRYHQAEFMRIGLREILGLADCEQNFLELSALADACLQYSLEVATKKQRLTRPPLAIIGLGKLGGSELNYGSDLDVVFVAQPKATKTQVLNKIATEVMELLASPTELGVAFQVDARLRPDGEKGMLVPTLSAFRDYYQQRAQLWELQAISRARPIAGDAAVSQNLLSFVHEITNLSKPNPAVAAHTPDWKARIARMRQRIVSERTRPGEDALAIKTGVGGLVDAEFMAQAICLGNGWYEPNTLKVLQRASQEGILRQASGESLVDAYRRLRRVEAILRRWSYAGETTLPTDAPAQYRVAMRCGFTTSDRFLHAVARYRTTIRKAYLEFFGKA